MSSFVELSWGFVAIFLEESRDGRRAGRRGTPDRLAKHDIETCKPVSSPLARRTADAMFIFGMVGSEELNERRLGHYADIN